MGTVIPNEYIPAIERAYYDVIEKVSYNTIIITKIIYSCRVHLLDIL